MLPDFRFLIGAALAIAVLGIAASGVITATRLAHSIKMSPLEAARTLAFAERADWDQYNSPSGTRRRPESLDALFDRFARGTTGSERVTMMGGPPVAPSAATAETPAEPTAPVPAPQPAAKVDRVASLPAAPADQEPAAPEQEPAQTEATLAPAQPDAQKAPPLPPQRAARPRAAKAKARARKTRTRTAVRQPAPQMDFPFPATTPTTPRRPAPNNNWPWNSN